MNKKLGRLIQPNLSVYFVLFFGFAALTMIQGQVALGIVEMLAYGGLFALYEVHRSNRKKQLHDYVAGVTSLGRFQDDPEQAPFPVALIRLGDGAIMWSNDRFLAASGCQDGVLDPKISEVIPAFSTDWLGSGKTEYGYDVTMNKRRFRVYGSSFRGNDPAQTMMAVLYFSDLTELYQVRDEYIRSRPVVSIILIDNYEDLTKNLNEGGISTLNAKLNDVITKWTEDYHGLLRKLERNRYLFVFEKKDLAAAVEEKFALLEQIHTVTNPAGVPASISLGVGVDGSNFDECYHFAALSIEMALSRGGDQAVVKDRLNFAFYGGRAQESDHRSMVRSRVTANTLMELIGQSSHIFVMGHRNADLDALGAAAGVCCLCRKKGKRASIIMDLNKNACAKMLQELRSVPEYKDVFISGQDALLLSDSKSILIVVDTNRPDQVEFKPLLESINKVCVIDHHRRAADYISPVVVNFHETVASSASELVTELLQYGVERQDVLPVESKALLAGIFLDTKSFNVRTGERTFEAAAYLRNLGADTVEVKKLLQSDFQDTVAKYQIIKSARMYHHEIAVAALNSPTTRVLAAQASDELLNISGISTSFVLYPDGDQVIISARSIGDANVQVILEPLGGGGNAATAGAQMKNTTVKEAVDQLIASIDKFYAE